MNDEYLLMEQVILVDPQDNEIGFMSKLEAHQSGLLHRAFSIFVFNGDGELLLQQRAKNKYHSPALWSNTCCSHPRPGESTFLAATRRLEEEMGLTCRLEERFQFQYFAEFNNGLKEHELDYVFFGHSDLHPRINPDEVNAWKYFGIEELENDMADHPDHYTEWLKISFPEVVANIRA